MRQSSIVSVILIDLAEYRVVKNTVYVLISSKEKKKKKKVKEDEISANENIDSVAGWTHRLCHLVCTYRT